MRFVNIWMKKGKNILQQHTHKFHKKILCNSKKNYHFPMIPLKRPKIPCGNSVIKKRRRTATNNIVVRSARLSIFEGLL